MATVKKMATMELSKQQLADLAAGKTVRVWAIDKEGKPKIDPQTKRPIAEDRPIAAEDIMAHRIDGDRAVIVTIDGQKHDLALPAA